MTTLLLLLAMHGSFLALSLATVGARRDPANRTLAALVGVAALLALWLWLNRQPSVPGRDIAVRMIFPAWYLVGPLCLRYIQQFLRKPDVLSLGWVGLAPLMASVWVILWESQPIPTRQDPSAQLLNQTILYCGFWMLTALCGLRGWRSLQQAEQDPEAVLPRPDWQRAWLQALIALMLAYSGLDMVCTLSFLLWSSYPAALGLTSVVILSALIYCVGLVAIMPDGVMRRAPWPGKHSRHPEFSAEHSQALISRLESVMDKERLWQSDQLSLSALAKSLELSPHQLSHLFNRCLGCSFNDYVNRHRVAYAKRLLIDQHRDRSWTSVSNVDSAAAPVSIACSARPLARAHGPMLPRLRRLRAHLAAIARQTSAATASSLPGYG